MADLEPIYGQVASGDPVGAAYRLSQVLGSQANGRAFYEAGSVALGRRDELGEDALRFARLAFAEAVERDPELGEAHHDLATTMRELGMAEDAIGHYKRALELMPDDADSLIGLGAAQCDGGHLEEGIHTLERAAEVHPENGHAFATLGLALEAAGTDEKAAGAYAKAVARYDAALGQAEDDETAAELAERRRWARAQHAGLLERLERWTQAIVEFRRLYEEEQELAEAEAAAEAAAEEEEEDEDEAEVGPHADVVADSHAVAVPDALVVPETVAVSDAVADADVEAVADELAGAGDDADLEADADEVEAGRVGLERVFARLIQSGRYDLAFLVLDDLGGELSDKRTRATYAIYDPGDGLATIMVEHWEGGERERLDPMTGRKKR